MLTQSLRPAALRALALAALTLSAVTPPAFAQKANTAEGTIVFAVNHYGTDTMIDPVVIIRAGRYTVPPGDAVANDEMAHYRNFIRNFYRPGRSYRLLFGGGEAGSLEVVKYLEPGCVGLEASARLQTALKLGGQVNALATNSAAFGKGAGTRRAPTDAERASALELARRIFRQNKVAAARISKMEVNNLTAIDLNRDGRAELVGSFLITGEFGVDDAVFLVAEPGIDDYAVTLNFYHHGSEEDTQYRRLVDALDLDGDGTAELIVQGLYYESHNYFIYKRTRGAWRPVYEGGGGGC